MTSATAQPVLDRLAGLIHDDILQSLGVCVLEMELSRRFASKGQRTEAAVEMDGALAALEEAIEQSRGAMAELHGVTRGLPEAGPAPVAGLATVAMPTRSARLTGAVHATPRVEPDALVRALGGCLSQAERCRAHYRVGNDTAAFDAIGDLLDQLDDVAALFRELMGELRRATTLHPAPPTPTKSDVVSTHVLPILGG